MNADLEKIVNSVLINGEISDRSRGLLMKKAEQLGVDLIDFELELESKIYKDTPKFVERNTILKSSRRTPIKEKFGFPLWAVWLINVFAWIFFLVTLNPIIEIILGFCCTVCVFLALKHYKIKTPALFNLWFLAPGYIIYISVIDALWMFAWGISSIDL
ncbi:MAG: hypothetical protein PHE56_05480 [Bacteroidales bacterium]|nr:hypothetical protein [Bacteroidales bacterium]